MTLTQYQNVDPPGKGVSDTATLQKAFPSTPGITDYKNAQVAAVMKLLHDGVVNGNPDFPNQSLDWTGAPDGADSTKVGKDGGAPWTNFAPNVASAPDAIPSQQPAPPPGAPTASGAGSIKMPAETSPQIASQSAGGGVTVDVGLGLGTSGATP